MSDTLASVLRDLAAVITATADKIVAITAPVPVPVVVPPVPKPKITFDPPGPVGQKIETVAGTGWTYIGKIVCPPGMKQVSYVEVGADDAWKGTPKSIAVNGSVTIVLPIKDDRGFIKAFDPTGYADGADTLRLSLTKAPIPAVVKPVVAPAPAPTTAPPILYDGLKLAKAMKARTTFGVNWERERFFANFTYTDDVDAYYTALGVDFLRGFVCWKPAGMWDDVSKKQTNFWQFLPKVAPTKSQFSLYFPNIRAMIAKKKVVYLDLLDVVGLEDFTPELMPIVEQYIRDAAGWIKEQNFDPNYLVVGVANEWAGATNPEYLATRMKLFGVLRAGLPLPYVLSDAPAYWGHPESYLSDKYGKFVWNPDMGTIHMFHIYDRGSKADWVSLQTRLNAAALAAGGRPIANGELGLGNIWDGKDYSAGDGGWVSYIERQNPAMADSAPCLWACTQGDWTLNRGFNDPRFWDGSKGWDPKIEQAVKAAAAANAAVRNRTI